MKEYERGREGGRGREREREKELERVGSRLQTSSQIIRRPEIAVVASSDERHQCLI